MNRRSYGDLMTNEQVQALAEAVVAEGFEVHRSEVEAFLAAARRRGVASLLLDIAGGAGEPAAARYRALGRIVVGYCGGAAPTVVPTGAEAGGPVLGQPAERPVLVTA